MTRDKTPHITISDRDGLPYSKGLMASQVMVTGLSPVRAYQVAEAIEDRLRELGVPSISNAQLGELALGVLEDLAGERYARNFQRWREVEAIKVPLVVLIGGATGVGKSTLATQLATRLGIVRVVATDAIREVMRALFSHELMPTLHASSFEAGSVLREPPSKDEVVVGFREQTAAVAVGVQALVERAAMEGTHLIIEGAHVVPGFLDLEPWRERILCTPGYAPDLDLVAVAPDGRVAAFAILWLGPAVAGRREGHFEPVGTRPEFRRRGLARALLLDGMRRLRAAGATHALVETEDVREGANGLYQTVLQDSGVRTRYYRKEL